MGGSGELEFFLGVKRSLNGRRWLVRETDDRTSLALAQRLEVPEIVGRVLSARGVGLDEAEAFLNPTLKHTLFDPNRLKGMEEACERLASAVMQGESIAIFGDYDVDGATSSALLSRFLRAIGCIARIYIPDRMSEGYGPNEKALLKLKSEGISLVVTVDCGTTAFAPLKAAAEAGLDVIVVDHHEAEAKLPEAVAVINPKRLDDTGDYVQLAAVGVSFLLVVGLNRTLRQAGWYATRPEPDIMQWLDLVALGTVCDMVALTGVNRALVTQGLKVMAGRSNPGIRALADVSGITEKPGTYHAGFVLGPRINAGGRIGESGLGARLLATDDEAEAFEIAEKLDELNRQRREIENGVLRMATDQIEGLGEEARNGPLVLASGEGWHAGVVGIVASRLKERFNRPACVISLEGSTGHGSGRSITGVDLGSMIIAARQAGIIVDGGGHAMAAGFTVERRRIDELQAFLSERMAARIADAGIVPSLYIDGGLKVAGASMELASVLEMLEPFGSGNSEPRFAVTGARLAYAAVAGDNHLRCTMEGEDGSRLDGIAFRCLDRELGQALRNHDGAPFHIAGRLRVNTWRGRSAPQLIIDDAAPA
ncbi:MAG: single-stranded-DNA-specific exonuclease RecJ [Rhodospirillales bacterium]